MTACDRRRQDKAELLAVLRAAGADVSNPAKIRCPFHDDRNPSAAVSAGDDGVYRFRCYSGNCGVHGDVFDIEARQTGRDVADLMREYRQRHEQAGHKPATTRHEQPRIYPTIQAVTEAMRHVKAVHDQGYADPVTGDIPLVVLRIAEPGKRKRFIQCRPERGGWVMKSPTGTLPLYNRVGLAGSDTAVVVEGEKCVNYLRGLGITATTWPGGCQALLDRRDFSPLDGKRDVYLWPDNDTGGVDAMRKVARQIEALPNPPRLHWIDPAALGLPEAGDVVDYTEPHETTKAKRRAILNVLRSAEPMGASRDVLKYYGAVRAGRIRCVGMGWPIISRATHALMPGAITLLAGRPGVSKSFMLLQLARALDADNVPVVVRMLEKDRTYHLNRALAQHAGQSGLADFHWLADNAEEAEIIAGQYADFLDRFGRCIQDATDGVTALTDLAGWVERQAEGGARVIAIDPITLANASERRWEQDRKFMQRCGQAIGRFGASLVLTTHPPKGVQGAINLDHLAGGAAYTRAADTVLFIEHHAEPKDVTIKRSGFSGDMGAAYPMRFSESINRTVYILKARNGRGTGWRVGFRFESDSLTFQELGVIVRGDVATHGKTWHKKISTITNGN